MKRKSVKKPGHSTHHFCLCTPRPRPLPFLSTFDDLRINLLHEISKNLCFGKFHFAYKLILLFEIKFQTSLTLKGKCNIECC